MADDDGIIAGERPSPLIAEHRIAILVGVTIVIAFIFSAIGLFLYNTGGAAQLDLSRPDYEGVGEIVQKQQQEQQGSYVEYPATGSIDAAALKEFDRLYKKQLDNIESVNAFGGDPLSPDALIIGENSEAN